MTRALVFQPTAWFKALAASVLLAPIIWVIPLSWEFVEQRFHGPTYWFEYKSVTPFKESFQAGEEVVFESSRVVHRDVLLRFNDVLFCDFGGPVGRQTYSNYVSEGFFEAHEPKRRRWTYQGATPQRPAVCDLESEITAILDFDQKVQTYQGPQFRIIE